MTRRRSSKILKDFADVIPAWPLASLDSRVRREVVYLNFEGEQVDWPSEKVLSQMPHFTILSFSFLMKGSPDYPSRIPISSTQCITDSQFTDNLVTSTIDTITFGPMLVSTYVFLL